MIYWELFKSFLMIGFVSFGGGYAMMAPIGDIVASHNWMTEQQFTDAIAVAGMSPGPIATNTAIFVGYNVRGILGTIASALGMVLPSLIIILVVARYFYKFNNSYWVKSAFYGLRAIVTGLIMYGAITFALRNNIISEQFTPYMATSLLILVCCLFGLVKLRIHPIFVIIGSAIVGILIYS